MPVKRKIRRLSSQISASVNFKLTTDSACWPEPSGHTSVNTLYNLPETDHLLPFLLERTSTSRSIGQPLALGALDHFGGPAFVVNADGNPVVVAKIELRQIAVQVLFLAVLVGATHPALEQ